MKAYHRLSIAPMMAYTDRHFRYMIRLLSKRCLLYTEMVVGNTILYNRNPKYLDRILGFHQVEHPIAVQLGGDDPKVLAEAGRVCEDYGYDEINLNIGCPSDRVQRGRFGVCLMKEPEKVAELVAALKDAVRIPVTVKHRIGVDDLDDYPNLAAFVETVSGAGAGIFIGHARKAWLKGLSPAQNRTVPPLNYDYIYRLKRDFPHLNIIVNGGIDGLEAAKTHLSHVDGVMIGRAAYQDPQLLANADQEFFGAPPAEPLTAFNLIEAMDRYAHRQVERGERLSFVIKHLVGLFKHRPRARTWRRNVTALIQEKPAEFNLSALYRDTFGTLDRAPM